MPLPPQESTEIEADIAASRTALGPAAYHTAYAEGSTLTMDEAVAHALGEVKWEELAPVAAERLAAGESGAKEAPL
jgi:hypothetical protein